MPDPLKILHVVPTYLPATRYGGPIVSVHGLCRALATTGHEVHVFTTNVDGNGRLNVPLEKAVPMDGVTVWYFEAAFPRNLYRSSAMKRALDKRAGEFDIVHIHSVFRCPSVMAARAARKNGVPYVVSPRGMLVGDLIRRKSRWLKLLWLGFLERKELESAAAIHATAELERTELERLGWRLPAIHVIPNGLTPEAGKVEGAAAEAEVPNGPFVLFIGRISWKKGLDRLIRAMEHVPNIPLVIAGNDEENYRPELERIALRSGVSGRVRFVGPVAGRRKETFLSKAALLVLASYSENFGNVVLEAMRAGCPVIVTPEVGLAEEVKRAGCGEVIEGNPNVLGPAMRSALNRPHDLRKMGEAGKRAALNYGWGTVAERMETLYRSVLK